MRFTDAVIAAALMARLGTCKCLEADAVLLSTH
jgi:hypothetical protein